TYSHNAERLVARYGEAIRYCKAAGTWYIYDGMRWRPDVLDAVMEFAKTTARGIHTEAADADDPREQRAKGKHAVASQSKTKLRSMIDLAQSIPQVAVRPENFDSRRDLLNTPNGTLNLTTFELQAHDPADLLTVITSAPYDPEARNDLWEDFLSRTTGGSPELQAFLQRAVGYTLSGRCSEEVCFYAYGPTASGKTTFAMALLAALGDGYGRSANFDTFLRRDAPTIYDDLARLVGARFVAAMETRDGATFNEGLLKSLTGRDPVTVRHLYQAWFTYVPQYVIWFGANMRARVAADDAAIWRRIIQLPFSNSVPAAERDPELKERLQDCRTCGAAILRWAIDGLKEWQRRRLAIPDGVRRATDEYQASQNPAADFVDDCCVRADTAWASSTALWEAYQHWAQGGGLKYPLTFRRFSRALEGMGCVPDRRGTPQQRGWAGVGLLAEGAQDT
ncbi:MAG: hypothetical protein FJ313_05770, partial [Gemmatimonadetes bacterium]|nr:hypothetical protein [Gemmatimonadota bacterium]